MLYVTTRNNTEIYTARPAVSEERGPDGGIFVPYKIVPFSDGELHAFKELSVTESIAKLLERLLGIRPSKWDVELHIGRYPLRVNPLSQRIALAETWHNVEGDMNALIKNLGKMISDDITASTPWLKMSVRIALLFAIYGELVRGNFLNAGSRMDISLVSGDFYGPMSVWYAREMGLPVENIICCCNENSGVWNLMNRGELRTDQPCIHTRIPEADVAVPEGLECLISACCGAEETYRYLDTVRLGKTYFPQTNFEKLRSGFHVSVISEPGMLRTIPSVYSSYSVILSPAGALAYAGLLDYRSRTGESRFGLILEDRGPETDIGTVADAFHVPPSRMEEWLRKI